MWYKRLPFLRHTDKRQELQIVWVRWCLAENWSDCALQASSQSQERTAEITLITYWPQKRFSQKEVWVTVSGAHCQKAFHCFAHRNFTLSTSCKLCWHSFLRSSSFYINTTPWPSGSTSQNCQRPKVFTRKHSRSSLLECQWRLLHSQHVWWIRGFRAYLIHFFPRELLSSFLYTRTTCPQPWPTPTKDVHATPVKSYKGPLILFHQWLCSLSFELQYFWYSTWRGTQVEKVLQLIILVYKNIPHLSILST